jgi:hypothetical protein
LKYDRGEQGAKREKSFVSCVTCPLLINKKTGGLPDAHWQMEQKLEPEKIDMDMNPRYR